jgi:tripartite-type tricarboxylate transporter receptor subunit TctC
LTRFIADDPPSGQLRALAITSAQRSTAFPDLPTVAEAGIPGFVVEGWYGLLAPAGTAAEIINLLNTSVEKAIQSEVFKTIETNEGLTFAPSTPEDFGPLFTKRGGPLGRCHQRRTY